MRWNQLADDIPRALALADVLIAAGSIDGNFDADERVIVSAMMMKVLGETELPPYIQSYIASTDGDKVNVADALARLELESDRDKKSLLKVVAEIVKADAKIDKMEKGFVTRLGKALGIPAADVKAFLA